MTKVFLGVVPVAPRTVTTGGTRCNPLKNPLDPERIHWKNPYAYVGRCDVEVRNV